MSAVVARNYYLILIAWQVAEVVCASDIRAMTSGISTETGEPPVFVGISISNLFFQLSPTSYLEFYQTTNS
jgi:hypothetical protein